MGFIRLREAGKGLYVLASAENKKASDGCRFGPGFLGDKCSRDYQNVKLSLMTWLWPLADGGSNYTRAARSLLLRAAKYLSWADS